MELNPTELSTLNATGSVQVVRVCEPQPDGVINGHPGKREERHGGDGFLGMAGCKYVTWSPIPSPFPPAGHREVIPDIGPCVWGESWCRQVKDLVTERAKQLFPNLEHEDERWADPDTYVWVGHIRKDTE